MAKTKAQIRKETEIAIDWFHHYFLSNDGSDTEEEVLRRSMKEYQDKMEGWGINLPMPIHCILLQTPAELLVMKQRYTAMVMRAIFG
jgi:hypothetical protein